MVDTARGTVPRGTHRLCGLRVREDTSRHRLVQQQESGCEHKGRYQRQRQRQRRNSWPRTPVRMVYLLG